MPISIRRSITLVQALSLIVAALVVTTPASAQFGGLKKKLKGDAAAKAAEKAGETAGADAAKPPEPTTAAAHGAPAATEQTLVLTPDVVDRLLTGLKAGREVAKKEDTPYGRYQKAKAAYDVAKPKCEAAMQPGIQRIAADEKKNARYQRLAEKMVEAGKPQGLRSPTGLQRLRDGHDRRELRGQAARGAEGLLRGPARDR
jgi:hypothetical protein